MARPLFLLTLLIVLAVPRADGQNTTASRGAPQAAAIGLELAPISNQIFEQVQSSRLKRGEGVVVQQVASDSPAALAGIKINDLLVSFNGSAIHDAAHFVKLIETTKPDRQSPLLVLRDGRELTLQVNLLPGAVTEVANQLKGQIKPGGPPEVIVEALPLDGGKLRITFTYYPEGKSKLDSVTCIGTLTEIETEVGKIGGQRGMPQAVRDLVGVALKRLRKLD